MTIYIEGEINNKMTELIANQVRAEFIPGENIDIIFNSNGGYIESAEDIADIFFELKENGSKLIAKNTGDVMSAATILWVICDERIWDDNYQFLIHNPYLQNTNGDADDLLKKAIFLTDIENDLSYLYQSLSNKTQNEILELMKQNRPMTLEELREYHFITNQCKRKKN